MTTHKITSLAYRLIKHSVYFIRLSLFFVLFYARPFAIIILGWLSMMLFITFLSTFLGFLPDHALLFLCLSFGIFVLRFCYDWLIFVINPTSVRPIFFQ